MSRPRPNFDWRFYEPTKSIQPPAFTPVEKTCIKCGEPFMAKGWNSKRCGQCQAKVAKN